MNRNEHVCNRHAMRNGVLAAIAAIGLCLQGSAQAGKQLSAEELAALEASSREALTKASEAAKQSGRRIIGIVTYDGCRWCAMLVEALGQVPELKKIVGESYVVAQIDWNVHQKVLKPGAQKAGLVPHVVIMDAEQKIIKQFDPAVFEKKNPDGYDSGKLAGFLTKWSGKEPAAK